MGIVHHAITILVVAFKVALTGISYSVSKVIKFVAPIPPESPPPNMTYTTIIDDPDAANKKHECGSRDFTPSDKTQNTANSRIEDNYYSNDKENSSPNSRQQANKPFEFKKPRFNSYGDSFAKSNSYWSRNWQKLENHSESPSHKMTYSSINNDEVAGEKRKEYIPQDKTRPEKSQNNANKGNMTPDDENNKENETRQSKQQSNKFFESKRPRFDSFGDSNAKSSSYWSRNERKFETHRRPKELKYYKVLDISRTASPIEIRQAYRKLALKWHPDKNLNNKAEAETRFREITEAYEVLSDPSKRSEYDRLGDAFNTAATVHSFRSPMEVFQEMFGLDSKVIFDSLGNDGLFFEPFCDAKENAASAKCRTDSQKRNKFEDLKNKWSQHVRPPFPSKGSPAKVHGASRVQRCAPSNITVTATKFLDGSTVITKTTVENGREIVENFEDGKLIARQVDGVAQADCHY